MKTLTVEELYSIVENCNTKYAIASTTFGEVAVNTSISKIAKRLVPYRPNSKTDVFSLRPCSFQEYITKKIPIQ